MRDRSTQPQPPHEALDRLVVATEAVLIVPRGDLPFFSQVNLRACAEQLRGRGYRVTLTKIQAR